jgi:hypothetical protein
MTVSNPKFELTDDEFIDIVNKICKKETAINQEYIPFTSTTDMLITDRLDSLGVMLFFVWLSEVFGILEEDLNAFLKQNNFTLKNLKEFISIKGTCSFTYDEFMETHSRCF